MIVRCVIVFVVFFFCITADVPEFVDATNLFRTLKRYHGTAKRIRNVCLISLFFITFVSQLLNVFMHVTENENSIVLLDNFYGAEKIIFE